MTGINYSKLDTLLSFVNESGGEIKVELLMQPDGIIDIKVIDNITNYASFGDTIMNTYIDWHLSERTNEFYIDATINNTKRYMAKNHPNSKIGSSAKDL